MCLWGKWGCVVIQFLSSCIISGLTFLFFAYSSATEHCITSDIAQLFPLIKIGLLKRLPGAELNDKWLTRLEVSLPILLLFRHPQTSLCSLVSSGYYSKVDIDTSCIYKAAKSERRRRAAAPAAGRSFEHARWTIESIDFSWGVFVAACTTWKRRAERCSKLTLLHFERVGDKHIMVLARPPARERGVLIRRLHARSAARVAPFRLRL